jgi:hypothetical protein
VKPSVQTLWLAVMLLGASVVAIYHGGRIALRREIDTPLVAARGGRALAIGLALLAVGLAGVLVAVLEGMKVRG